MKKKVVLFLFLLLASHFAQENEQNINRQSNLLLTQPISVTIGGDFIVNGSFTSSKIQRLDHFITSIIIQTQQYRFRNPDQNNVLNKVSADINDYALRNIILKRTNGETHFIDLLKFRFTGDFKNNPYLIQDDLIIFPSYDKIKDVVDISGAVNKATKFQFVEGDLLSDALLFAGGLNPVYENILYVEISRLDNSGENEEIIKLKIDENIKLKRGDRIRILANENEIKNYKVLILGEVQYPGFVYITKSSTTILDVINKAGGFKTGADLSNSELIRGFNSLEILKKNEIFQSYTTNASEILQPEFQIKLKQQKQLLEMLRLSNLTVEDSLFFNVDNLLRVLDTGSIIDFSKVTNPDNDESKFIVKEGDIILIPAKFDYVYVFGQVAKTGFVKYNSGKDYKYYLDMAGGLTERARNSDETVVIKKKEKNWITEQKEKLSIEPGDYIYVPKDVPKSTWFYLSRAGEIASIVGGIATIVLLITQIWK
ncbi:MAG: SLBB domain-containing protein [Bacteroidota bacterium]